MAIHCKENDFEYLTATPCKEKKKIMNTILHYTFLVCYKTQIKSGLDTLLNKNHANIMQNYL